MGVASLIDNQAFPPNARNWTKPGKPWTEYRYFRAVTATNELCGEDDDVTHRNWRSETSGHRTAKTPAFNMLNFDI